MEEKHEHRRPHHSFRETARNHLMLNPFLGLQLKQMQTVRYTYGLYMYIAIVSEFPSILIKLVINYRIDFYNTILL